MTSSNAINLASEDTPKFTNKFMVGLTGGIGSGKTTVTNMFAKRGVTIIDTDIIAHQLTAAGGIAIAPIHAAFGADFIMANGAMNRVKMRAHIFANPTAKQHLEAILHPLIRAETVRAAMQADGLYLLLVVPLLIESSHWRQYVTRVLVIDCDEQIQLQRVIQRDMLSEAQVQAIMATQASRQQRLHVANDIIINNTDANSLIPQVERLHMFYATLAQARKMNTCRDLDITSDI